MPFAAVHIGAGWHSPQKDQSNKNIARKATHIALKAIKNGLSAQVSATLAIKYLEDTVDVNAGKGSNLNEDGKVECDCSMMLHDGRWCAVVACSGIKNPIVCVSDMIDDLKIPNSIGRVKPMILAGDGPLKWARANGSKSIMSDQETLITDQSKRTLDKWSRLDTCGIIVCDNMGNLASASSSGGILMKKAGRVGQAGVYGAGCWANTEFACCTSGTGEKLIPLMLPLMWSLKIKNNDNIHDVIESTVFSSELVGAIALHKIQDEFYFNAMHTTPSFVFAYGTDESNCKCIISRLSKSEKKVHLGFAGVLK